MNEWTDWHGCYEDGWGELIVGEAFAHPAKFCAGLIERIYKHGFERGWWVEGDVIGDPFGGIGGGAIYAAYNGLRWIGVELESEATGGSPFVELFHRNVKLHQRRWENGGDPIPEIIQGDSREFAKLVSCSAIVTSPPYADLTNCGEYRDPEKCRQREERYLANHPELKGVRPKHLDYGQTPGQIANLKAWKLDGVVTSPPYAESIGNENKIDYSKAKGKHDGLKPSPGRDALGGNYGSTEGNIGNLKAVVTSPPYAESLDAGGAEKQNPDGYARKNNWAGYGRTPGQVGNTFGESYWQAMEQVYDQCRQATRPGGVLVVVVKDYVSKGKKVPLCDQTLTLLESLGFKLIERIRAWVTKTTVHDGLFGKVKETVERKSFFRRLAEKKGSPPIDWEEVICARAP